MREFRHLDCTRLRFVFFRSKKSYNISAKHRTRGRPDASNLTCLARFATMEGSDSMDGSSVPDSVIKLLEADGTMMDKGGRAILMGV